MSKYMVNVRNANAMVDDLGTADTQKLADLIKQGYDPHEALRITISDAVEANRETFLAAGATQRDIEALKNAQRDFDEVLSRLQRKWYWKNIIKNCLKDTMFRVSFGLFLVSLYMVFS